MSRWERVGATPPEVAVLAVTHPDESVNGNSDGELEHLLAELRDADHFDTPDDATQSNGEAPDRSQEPTDPEDGAELPDADAEAPTAPQVTPPTG